MTPHDLLADMASHPDTEGSWSAAFDIALGASDTLAAQILLWAETQYPSLEMGDLANALDAAKWWLTLFAAMKKSDERKARKE